MFAAVVMILYRELGKIPTESWKNSIKAHPEWRALAKIESWLQFVSDFQPPTIEDLYRINANGETHLVGVCSAMISASPNISVEDRLLSQIITLDTVAHSNFRATIEPEFERKIVSDWTKIARESRFLLINPEAASVRIINAASGASGLRRASRVLLAAKNGVHISVPNNLIQEMTKLAFPDG